jgi:hypothetical protein
MNTNTERLFDDFNNNNNKNNNLNFMEFNRLCEFLNSGFNKIQIK